MYLTVNSLHEQLSFLFIWISSSLHCSHQLAETTNISAMPLKLTELEADEYQRQGQELYRQGKYQAALQRFNAVMPLPCA